MSDSSLLGKAVKKARKVGSDIYANRYDIAAGIVSGVIIVAGELICYSIGNYYGYERGCRDGWNLSNEHTKQILEAANGSHETIIKQ